jgi:hypothetical protein
MRRQLLSSNRPALDFFSDLFERTVHSREELPRDSGGFANQPQQQMLRFDGNTAELEASYRSKNSTRLAPSVYRSNIGLLRCYRLDL